MLRAQKGSWVVAESGPEIGTIEVKGIKDVRTDSFHME